jgi:thiamine biosynthesis lipoprotein ApbE
MPHRAWGPLPSPFHSRYFVLSGGFCLLWLWALAARAPAQMPSDRMYRQSRIMMGTAIEITLAQVDPHRAPLAMHAAFREIARIDLLLSHYREDSEISAITRQAGEKETTVSGETLEVIQRALHFSQLSGGAFDITVGPVFRLWNFREAKIPEEKLLQENLPRVDYRKIKLDPRKSSVFLPQRGMQLDLGAIAKGYAADRAALVLKENGVENFLVNAGGISTSMGKRKRKLPGPSEFNIRGFRHSGSRNSTPSEGVWPLRGTMKSSSSRKDSAIIIFLIPPPEGRPGNAKV